MRGNNLALGKAGELRVASELLLRGYEVFLTITDTGVDLILGNGKRLQVKTARVNRLSKTNPNGYVFSLKAWCKEGTPRKVQQFTDVDYLICWAVEDNAFFIIPTSYIRGKYAINIHPDSKKSQFVAFKNNWEIL